MQDTLVDGGVYTPKKIKPARDMCPSVTGIKGYHILELYGVVNPKSDYPLSVHLWYGNQGILLRGVCTVEKWCSLAQVLEPEVGSLDLSRVSLLGLLCSRHISFCSHCCQLTCSLPKRMCHGKPPRLTDHKLPHGQSCQACIC